MSNKFIDPTLPNYWAMAYHVNRKDEKNKYPKLVRRTKTEPKLVRLMNGSLQAIPPKYIKL